MPNNELIYEQALEALKALFEGIVGNETIGDPYWYTPSTVERTHGPIPSILNDRFNDEKTVIYAIWQDELRTKEEMGQFTENPRFFVLVARRHPREDAAHREASPKRGTVQNRLVRDAKKRLSTDLTLGGLVDNTEIRTWVQSTRRVHFPLWAVALGRGQMLYDADAGTP